MQMSSIILGVCATVCLLAMPVNAAADHHAESPGAETPDCSVQSSNGQVVILVCKPGLDQLALRTAGEAACEQATGICNAWFWEDADIAPETAPASDADLDKDKVREAIAVWVHDSARLMLLKKSTQGAAAKT